MILQRIYPSVPPPPHGKDVTHRSMMKELLTTVIRDNIFEFKDQFYRQVRGIAMGTRMAPAFANLFMAEIEEKALSTWKTCPPPLIWSRFLDDVFLVWEHGEENLALFVQHLNSILPSITLTISHSLQQVDFLDITVFKGPRFDREGVLDIRPFSKPMASFAYLHYRSCHAPWIFKNIVRGEAIRALRNSSSSETFEREVSKLLTRFVNRGYPKSFVLSALEDVSFSTRTSRLSEKSDPETTEDYSTFLSIRQHPAILAGEVSSILSEGDLPIEQRVTRTRAENLGDLLVTSSSSTKKREMTLRSGKRIPWTESPSTSTAESTIASTLTTSTTGNSVAVITLLD